MDIRIFTSTEAPGFTALYDLYRRIFTDDDEAEDLEGIRLSINLLKDRGLIERYGSFNEYWIAACNGEEPLGGVNFTTFGIPALGLVTAHINYLFTDRRYRKQGIGTFLVEKVKEISKADYIFCEQNIPSKMSEEALEKDFAASGITAWQRIAWWHGRGFRRLETDYVQPPLSKDKSPAYNMSLNVYGIHESIPSAIVEAHLRRFYYIAVLKNSSDSEPFVEKLLGKIQTTGAVAIHQ